MIVVDIYRVIGITYICHMIEIMDICRVMRITDTYLKKWLT